MSAQPCGPAAASCQVRTPPEDSDFASGSLLSKGKKDDSMRFSFLALAFVLVASANAAIAQDPPKALLTLDEAMRLAEIAHPLVRSREAQLAAAEGLRREAAAPFIDNPEIGTARARRSAEAPDGRAREWTFGISQAIEIAGQQSYRRQVAAANLDAVHAGIDDARRVARAEAALRFHAVLAAQLRVQIEQRALELFEDTAQAVEERRAAGEDTRLDANVALIEAERARNALASARENLLDARSALGTVLQLPPSAIPELAGQLSVPAGETPYQLDRLLASVQNLPRQRALAATQDAARARVALERANRYPEVTVGVNVGREGPAAARERVTTLSVSLPLPLFQRNDAALGQATTQATQAEIESTVGIRNSQAQVRRLWSRLDSQRERLQRLQGAMVSASELNQQLAAKSRQAGQIGLLDQLLVNRQALDAARELNDALAEYYATRIELEEAAGWLQEGSTK
ncbi:MAG: TolC family protein [Burkholderiaceae bacterium]|nr:TolC family protein [Burkholderiaceae bacterium]